MHLLFLIPLIFGLVASYIALNAEAEIAYLTAVITAISLTISLILAPWQIQLLILLVVVLGAKEIWQRLDRNQEIEIATPNSGNSSTKEDDHSHLNDQNQETNLQRKYRGISYQHITFDQNLVEETETRKYRGITWTKPKLPQPIVPKIKTNLKYRGNNVTGENDN